MPQARFVYLGIRGTVIALNSANGEKLWTNTLIKSADFVNVVLDGNNLYAAAHAEIFCLDPATGITRWRNPLKGYGWGLVTIAGAGIAQNAAALDEKRRRDSQASAAIAGSSAATGT